MRELCIHLTLWVPLYNKPFSIGKSQKIATTQLNFVWNVCLFVHICVHSFHSCVCCDFIWAPVLNCNRDEMEYNYFQLSPVLFAFCLDILLLTAVAFPETCWNIATQLQFNRKYSVSKSVSGKSKVSKTYSRVKEWTLFEIGVYNANQKQLNSFYLSRLVLCCLFQMNHTFIQRSTNELFEPLKCFLLWFHSLWIRWIDVKWK